MATTTPNFGWAVPTSTDLVKDGAVAIETLGDSIDASLVDLKGGTTGQVLAKASGTDMDFSWVAQDDSNAIQNAIVDAKGDLIGASASDTPARLAVGADYGFLQADSGQSTGLAWNSGAWTTYTPTVTSGSGSYTTITVTGGYQRIGKTCTMRAYVLVTDRGTAAGNMIISLPFTGGNFRQAGSGCDQNLNGFAASVLIPLNATGAIVAKYDFTTFWTNGIGVAINATYEVA
jgi:hypothetical protein